MMVVTPLVRRMNRESEGKSSGIPHLAKNERDTRISCTRHQATAACAAFIEESRMKLINANRLHRKSGGMGHPSLVRERKAGCLDCLICDRDRVWHRTAGK